LIVRVDGTEALHTQLHPRRERYHNVSGCYQDFTVNFPAGKRVIEIANDAGADWVLIDSFEIRAGAAGGISPAAGILRLKPLASAANRRRCFMSIRPG